MAEDLSSMDNSKEIPLFETPSLLGCITEQDENSKDKALLEKVNEVFGLAKPSNTGTVSFVTPSSTILQELNPSIQTLYAQSLVEFISKKDSIQFDVEQKPHESVELKSPNSSNTIIFHNEMETPNENRKECTQCKTTKSPGWRRGKNNCLLCNRCGLQWKRKITKQNYQNKFILNKTY